ncbi:MAG: hypothetical protein AB7D57_02535 [Desulfovibrionaceae bacterium]
METMCNSRPETKPDEQQNGTVYVPYPGADEKYDDGQDWRLYNPEKYRDPNWSPEKE